MPRGTRAGREAIVHAVVAVGAVVLACLAYLLVMVGFDGVPSREDRGLVVLTTVATLVAVGVAVALRRPLREWANVRLFGEYRAPDEALRTFGGRMSRAVPMDELLLQLAETLRSSMGLATAEVWTGSDGVLQLAVSVPDRVPAEVRLRGEETSVVARSHAQGRAWMQVWLPQLAEGRGEGPLRCVSIAHLGELVGLLVLERRPGDPDFAEAEDRVLVDLSRQVGLALHNVRLDSALQASLDELQVRNQELVQSRARIVTAADESRRQIERNLHDGAQQHLVALAVKIGLVGNLLGSDPDTASSLVGELREDVQATLTELRELAHGIYPPLLRERGLTEAVRAAAGRMQLDTVVEADDIGRCDSEVEAALYFCCLEAMQNAAKYAGEDASVVVRLSGSADRLCFEVSDDGAGFDPATTLESHGFVNMRDRLGAFDGALTVRSSPGRGTCVAGTVPLGPPPGSFSRGSRRSTRHGAPPD